MSLLSSAYVWILLIKFVSAQDALSQQNDIIPNQQLQVPHGMFCFFTCSFLIFEERMQKVAPSAYRIGAARLTKMKMTSSTSSEPYDSLWGAAYFIQQEEYSNVIQHSSSQNSVPFVATMEIETITNETTVCVFTDMGLQGNTYPPTQSCDQCNNGSNGSSSSPSMADYQQELASMGVPDAYFKAIQQLPTMQNSPSAGGNSQQKQQPTQQTPPSPSMTGAGIYSGAQPTPKGDQTNRTYSPSLGASVQGQSPQTAQFQQQQPNTDQSPPTTTSNGTSTGQPPHQLRNSYQNPAPSTTTTAPQSFSKPKSPAYAPFSNEFLPTNSIYSLGNTNSGPSGYDMYQPRFNFSSGQGASGNSQSDIIPGFSFASVSPEYSNLKPRHGTTLLDYQTSMSESFTRTSVSMGAGV